MSPPLDRDPDRTALAPAAVEQAVVGARLHLYNRGLPCGAAALQRYLRAHIGLTPVPSVRRLHALLTQYGLTHGRTGWYEREDLPPGVPPSAWVPPHQRRYYQGPHAVGPG
jgi:hypothetical protein